MPTLIETLQVQHAEIIRIAERITELLIGNDAPAVCTALDALEGVLLSHFALEDSKLYPALTRAAEQSQLEVPTKIARTYQHNMITISVAVKAFLEKYARSFDLDDFRRDWTLVSQLLSDRIASEEATLYPLYTSWIVQRPPATSPK